MGHEPGHETVIGSSGIQVDSGIHVQMHTIGPQRIGLHVKMHTNGTQESEGEWVPRKNAYKWLRKRDSCKNAYTTYKWLPREWDYM